MQRIKKIVNKLLPKGTYRRKIVKRIFFFLKPFYQKIKLAFHSKNQILFFENSNEVVLKGDYKSSKKIAVHIHLFYLDLAKEFSKYLKNIPNNFDLFITLPKTTNDKKIKHIYKIFKKNKHLDNLKIVKTENIGRDTGPMFVLLSEEICKYDILLHIHSKKSLRTGDEQQNWRRYLLRNLIGNKYLVRNYLQILENYNFEIAFPDFYRENCSRVSLAVLSEKQLMINFYKKIGLDILENDSLLFSAGCMFWCKTTVFKELFDAHLTWDDFKNGKSGKEEGLEYVLERIPDALCKKHKTSLCVFDDEANTFFENRSNRLHNEISNLTKENFVSETSQHKFLSFDIFDTLVTRCIDNPDSVFEVTDFLVAREYGFAPGQYYKTRKLAEIYSRTKDGQEHECNLNEIYQEFGKINNLTNETTEKIMQLEIETDLNFMTPREDVFTFYKELNKKKQKIDLVSDMYYSSNTIRRILNKCGYKKWDNLYVSSEIGFRKDNWSLWKWYFKKKKFKNSFCHMHIGDNFESDVHKLWMHSKYAFHLPSSNYLYKLSPYNFKYEQNIETKILVGLVVNKCLFNSPFYNNETHVTSEYNLGYGILGPMFLFFTIWLISNTKNKTLLFLSREGYYLQQIYELVKSLTKKEINQKHYYFLTSRRACTVPNIVDENDINKIIDSYNGNAFDFFRNRFGIEIEPSYKQKEIHLPDDNKFMQKLAKNYYKEIFAAAKQEKENYETYIRNENIQLNDDCFVVDVGYSGTAQYELSKLFKCKIGGAYFGVSDNLKPLKLGCEVLSCFNDSTYYKLNKKTAFDYSFILECFLIAPNGQLICFDKNGKSIHREPPKKQFERSKKVFEGTKDFINDFARLYPGDILDAKLDKQFILNLYNSFGKIVTNDSNSTSVDFELEDYYYQNKIVKY